MGIPGGDLNYDETVVYKNEAIRPVYLVTYGQPEPGEVEEASTAMKVHTWMPS